MFQAPLPEGLHDRPKGCAFFCETISVSSWLLGRWEFFDQFRFDKSRKSICQDVGRNALRGRGELTKMRSSQQQVADNQQRPLVADQVQRAGHRATGANMFHGTQLSPEMVNVLGACRDP